jgi:hypothetical protein
VLYHVDVASIWNVFEDFFIVLCLSGKMCRYCPAESVQGRAGKYLRARAQTFYKFQEILSHNRENSEEQNKVLEFL